jgi:hypothetical protein
MDVVLLDGKLEYPEIRARGRTEGAAHGGEHGARAKATDRLNPAERHVYRMRADVSGPGSVGHAGSPPRTALAAGAGSPSTPRSGCG